MPQPVPDDSSGSEAPWGWGFGHPGAAPLVPLPAFTCPRGTDSLSRCTEPLVLVGSGREHAPCSSRPRPQLVAHAADSIRPRTLVVPVHGALDHDLLACTL